MKALNFSNVSCFPLLFSKCFAPPHVSDFNQPFQAVKLIMTVGRCDRLQPSIYIKLKSIFFSSPVAIFPPRHKTTLRRASARCEGSSFNVQLRLHRRSPASSRKIPPNSPSDIKWKKKNASGAFSCTCLCRGASRIRSTASSRTIWRSDSRKSPNRISTR